MKKVCGMFLFCIFALVMAIGFVMLPTHRVSFAADGVPGQSQEIPEGEEGEEEPEEPTLVVPEELFQYVHISQDGDGQGAGYTFKPEDFVLGNVDNVPATLYTNKTVTIYCDYPFEGSSPVSFSLSFNGQPMVFENTVSDPEDPRIYTYNERNYFFLDATGIEQETRTTVFMRLAIGANSYELNFVLVQTPHDFAREGVIFEYKSSSTLTQTIAEPTTGCIYPTMTLTTPNGTANNPIYVRFIYCGETFELYNIDGVLYNSLDDEEITAFQQDNIVFDLSGTYTIDIFDKTAATNFPGCNILHFSFIIENNENLDSLFYYSGYTEDGEILMSSQISNKNTTVDLRNIGNPSIKQQVQRVTVERTYQPTPAENAHESLEYRDIDQLIRDPETGEDRLDASLFFDKDGSYIITTYFLINGSVEEKEFRFTLIESIRTQLDIDGVTYRVEEGDPSNVTTRYDITREVETSYRSTRSPITSMSQYSFYVLIARSAPSIDGIGNNARVNKDVSLTVRGVGDIDVTVTQDGKSFSSTHQSGDKLPTFVDPGKYVVRITDQMGTTITKTFTIGIRMNTAAMILIIIAAVMILLMIVFIIISRMKFKVR